MTAKMIEGLTGSYANMNLRETPIQNYQRASQQRNAEGMRRSLDYASQMNQRIVSYQEKTTEGMREAVEEAKKQQQLLQSKAVERAAARQEALASARENRAGLLQSMRYDRVEISSEGKNWLQQRKIENSGMKQNESSALAERNASYGLSSLQNAQQANAARTQQAQANAVNRTQAQASSASRSLYQSNSFLRAQQSTQQTQATGTQRTMSSLGSSTRASGTAYAGMTYGNRMATALSALYQE